MKPPVYSADWPEDVQALYRHDMQEIWDRRISPQIWNQYHNQLDYYLGIAGNEPLKILDVGCAQGTLALKLAELGHRVTAVDIRQQFLEYARSRHEDGDIQFLQANVLEDELPGDFDLIFANQIIEHLVYPAELLQRLKNLLKPGGRLVVTTPNGDYVKNGLPSYRDLGNPKDWEHMQFSADGDGHFYAYRSRELIDFFKASGFSEVKAKFFETPFISGHMKLRYLHGVTPTTLLRVADRSLLLMPWLRKKMTHQLLLMGTCP
ncbi:MAG: class I SAM-dependent methyltransferase, partial [Arenimonas sp.]